MKYLLALILVLMPLPVLAEGAHYYAPPGQFNAVMQVTDQGMTGTALFGNATGSFIYDGKSVSGIRLAVDATSLVANNPQAQRDLASFIDTNQFSEIRFTAMDTVAFMDGKASIKGNLTLHGVSKPAILEATISQTGKASHSSGAWTGESEAISFSLHGNVKRADFGISGDPNAPERYGDTITLQLEMQAIRQ